VAIVSSQMKALQLLCRTFYQAYRIQKHPSIYNSITPEPQLIIATNSRSSAPNRLLKCSKIVRNSPSGTTVFYILRVHSAQTATEAGHLQITWALDSPGTPQIGQIGSLTMDREWSFSMVGKISLHARQTNICVVRGMRIL
jgi:hypothetical protein